MDHQLETKVAVIGPGEAPQMPTEEKAQVPILVASEPTEFVHPKVSLNEIVTSKELLDKYMAESNGEPIRIIVDEIDLKIQELQEYVKEKSYPITFMTSEEKQKQMQMKIVKEQEESNSYIHLSLLAKKNCKTCWERGYIGTDVSDGKFIPCHCAQKRINSLSGNERDMLIQKTKMIFKEAAKG